jgi:cell division GTPase FtsZ
MAQGNVEKSSSSTGVDAIGTASGKKRSQPSPGLSLLSQPETKKAPVPASSIVVLGFVFAGGCGTNNARRFMASTSPEEYPYLYILVANTDGPQLRQFFDPTAANYDLTDIEKENLGKWIASIDDTKQLTILQLGESGSGAGGDPEVGRKSTEARREEIEHWMKPLRTVIIAGGAGKGTGGGALPVFQKIARDLDKSPLTIVTMPFAYEGGGRMKKANATLSALYEQGPAIPIYNENVPKELSRGKGFKDVYDEINNASIQPVFLGIREVTQVVGDMQNVDIADWRRVLSVGNYVTCDFARMDADEVTDRDRDIREFMNRLFRQDPYQDHRTRKNATGMLAWAHGQ